MPDGPDGAVFLVYDNFRVILHWNRSDYFALTAGYLADRIAGKNTVLFAR
jgi:membrane-bound lytic murein transglycosylase B